MKIHNWLNRLLRTNSADRCSRRRSLVRRSLTSAEVLEDRSLLATFTVTSLDDPNGSAESQAHLHDPPIGAIDSLRHAIEAANAEPGPDVIRFLPELFADGSGTITLDQPLGELPITDDLIIYGPGAELLTVRFITTVVPNAFRVDSGTNVTIHGLTISRTAGIQNDGNLTLDHVVMSGNSNTLGNGSAVFNTGDLSINNSTIRGTGGNGIVATGGTVSISNSTLSGNHGLYSGSALHATATTVHLVNSTISGNTIALLRSSGAVYLADGNATLTNVTIANNKTDGLVLAGTQTTLLNNTIIAGNVASASNPSARDIRLLDSASITSGSRNNLIGDPATSGGLANGVNGNIVGDGAGGALDIDDILDTTLRDLGGATLVHPLVVDSPAIDAGDNAVAVDADGNPLISDQRKFPFQRIFDGDTDFFMVGAGTSIVDIGAYEVQEVATSPSPNALVVSKGGDVADGNYASGELTLREAFDLANRYLDPNVITFTEDVRDTITLGGTGLIADSDIELSGPGARPVFAIEPTDPTELENLRDTTLTISGSGMERILTVNAGVHLVAANLTLAGTEPIFVGNAIETVGGLLNNGIVVLENMVFSNLRKGVPGVALLNANASSEATLRHVTFSGNHSTVGNKGGGAIQNERGLLRVYQTSFLGNSASVGGAIENNGGRAVLEDTVFDGNTAVGSSSLGNLGGAITNFGGEVTMTRGVVINNSAGEGGGIYSTGGSLAILDTTIDGNAATANSISNGYGGGISSKPLRADAVTVTRTTISNNTAVNGGGLYINGLIGNPSGKTVHISNSTISSNEASGSGGGVYNVGASRLVIVDSTIAYNYAGTSSGIGGLDSYGSVETLKNNIIAQNSSRQPTFRKIQTNSRTAARVVRGGVSSDIRLNQNVINAPQFNLIKQFVPSNFDARWTQSSNGNMFGTSPEFVDPGDGTAGLAKANGALTATHSLQVGSPAVDAGQSDRLFDQSGQPVVDIGGLTNVSSANDIGAFEAQFVSKTYEWESNVVNHSQFSASGETVLGVGYATPNNSITAEPGFLGFEFDPDAFSFGGIAEGWFGDYYGAEVRADIRLRAGLEYGYYVNGGSVDVDYDGLFRTIIDDPQDGGKVMMDTYAEILDGALYTTSPKFGFWVDLVIEFDLEVGGEACLIGCVSGDLPKIDIDFRQNLFSINDQVGRSDGNPQFDGTAPKLDGDIKFVGADVVAKMVENAQEDVADKLDEANKKVSRAEIDKQKAEKELSKATTDAERAAATAKVNSAQSDISREKSAQSSLTKKKNFLDPLDGCIGPAVGVSVCVEEADGDLLGLQATVQQGAQVGSASIGKELGSLQVTVPDVQLVDQSIDPQTGRLYASTDDFADGSERDKDRQVASLVIDLAGILGPLVGIPAGKYTVDLGPLSIAAQLLSYNLQTTLGITQDVDVTPSFESGNLMFDKPVIINGKIVTHYQFQPGQRIDIDPEDNSQPVTVTPSIKLKNTFHNDVGLDIDVTGVFEALSLSLSAFGKTFVDVGPLVRDVHKIGGFDLGSVFNRTFDLATPSVLTGSFQIGNGIMEPGTIPDGKTPATAINVTPGTTFELDAAGTYYLRIPVGDAQAASYDTINFDLLSEGGGGVRTAVVAEQGLILQDTGAGGVILSSTVMIPNVPVPGGSNPTLGSAFRITDIRHAGIKGSIVVGVTVFSGIRDGMITLLDKLNPPPQPPVGGDGTGYEITAQELLTKSHEVTASIVDNDGGLDVDGDGTIDPLTDGQLFLRYMAPNNLRGSALISGVVSPNATRATAAEIEGYLASILTLERFDVDFDGSIFAETDGMYLIRHMSGPGMVEPYLADMLDGARTTSTLDTSRIANSGFVSRSTGDVFGVMARHAIAENAAPGASGHYPLNLTPDGAAHSVTVDQYDRYVAFNETYVVDKDDPTQRSLVASGAVGTPLTPTGIGPDDPTSQASVNEFSRRLQMETNSAKLATDKPVFVKMDLADSWEFVAEAGTTFTQLVLDNGVGDNGFFDHIQVQDATETDFEIFLPDTNQRFDVTMNSADQPIMLGGAAGVSRFVLIRKDLPLKAMRGFLADELPNIDLTVGLVMKGDAVAPNIQVTMTNPTAPDVLIAPKTVSQVVGLTADADTIQFGKTVDVTARYNITGSPDENPGALAIQVHYDSSVLTVGTVQDLLGNGFVGFEDAVETIPDGDMHTDRMVSFVWMNPSGGGLGGSSLPNDVARLQFTAKTETGNTSVNVTRGESGLIGFEGTSSTFTVVPTTFVVDNTTTDTNDGDFSAGNLTLREAIDLANAASSASAIRFASTVTNVTLTSSLPTIATNTQIIGPGARQLTINGPATGRAFSIAASQTVDISGFAIVGGGILNDGTLNVQNVAIRNVSEPAEGGAILNNAGASLFVSGSELSGNAATTGGGLHNKGTAEIVNTTVSGNTAGGGISSTGSTTLRNVTVTNNTTANGSNGGVISTGGTFVVRNSIVLGNTPDTFPTIITDVANSVTTGTVSDVLNTTLADNGGQTRSHALAANSAAIDFGSNGSTVTNSGVLLTSDQRARARIFGAAVDAGAVEQVPAAGFTVTNPATTSVSEDGTSVDFSIVLTAPPATGIRLNIASSDTTESAPGTSFVNFTSGNWNVPQFISVSGVADGEVDGDQTSTITISVDQAASDDTFDLLPNHTFAVTTTDDGTAAIDPGDLDGTGSVSTTDAFLIFHIVTGLPAPAITQFLGEGATISAADAKSYLETHVSQLDINGDGSVTATDAFLLFHVLTGLPTPALTQFLGAGATRTAAEVVTHINTVLRPGNSAGSSANSASPVVASVLAERRQARKTGVEDQRPIVAVGESTAPPMKPENKADWRSVLVGATPPGEVPSNLMAVEENSDEFFALLTESDHLLLL